MKKKIWDTITDAIPFVVYIGGLYLATQLTGIFDRIILAIIWGSYIFAHISNEKQEREIGRAKRSLYDIEKSHYNQTKRLNIAEELLSPEQREIFWEETKCIGYISYKYQEFDPYECDQTLVEKD